MLRKFEHGHKRDEPSPADFKNLLRAPRNKLHSDGSKVKQRRHVGSVGSYREVLQLATTGQQVKAVAAEVQAPEDLRGGCCSSLSSRGRMSMARHNKVYVLYPCFHAFNPDTAWVHLGVPPTFFWVTGDPNERRTRTTWTWLAGNVAMWSDGWSRPQGQ